MADELLQYEQLDLFAQDNVTAGKGYMALENLNFEEAIRLFRKNLSENTENERAKHGLALSEYWEKIFREYLLTGGEEGCDYLWSKIICFPFDEMGKPWAFRRSLLNRLAVDIERIDTNMFTGSDLCLGRVLIELEDYNKALPAFENLLLHKKNCAKLSALYGDAHWHAGNKFQARINYVKALLIAPREVSVAQLPDKEFERMSDEAGPFLAPIYVWIECGMPDLGIYNINPTDPDHKNPCEIYTLLLRAEKMRIKRNYDEMISLRRKLKKRDPEIFQTYIMVVSNRINSG